MPSQMERMRDRHMNAKRELRAIRSFAFSQLSNISERAWMKLDFFSLKLVVVVVISEEKPPSSLDYWSVKQIVRSSHDASQALPAFWLFFVNLTISFSAWLRAEYAANILLIKFEKRTWRWEWGLNEQLFGFNQNNMICIFEHEIFGCWFEQHPAFVSVQGSVLWLSKDNIAPFCGNFSSFCSLSLWRVVLIFRSIFEKLGTNHTFRSLTILQLVENARDQSK